jgi:23S rRNA (guanosine2251-2'-O)-methyltransferase
VGTDLEAKKSYQDIIIDTPLCLVIGSEGKGISRIVKNNVDYNVKIDMVGQINSLNASVSAGILIFDILRRKLND